MNTNANRVQTNPCSIKGKVYKKQKKMKITEYEQAATLLRLKGYSIQVWKENREIKSLSVEDYTLSADEHAEEIRELLGEGWLVNKISNFGLITIDKDK